MKVVLQKSFSNRQARLAMVEGAETAQLIIGVYMTDGVDDSEVSDCDGGAFYAGNSKHHFGHCSGNCTRFLHNISVVPIETEEFDLGHQSFTANSEKAPVFGFYRQRARLHSLSRMSTNF